MPTVHYNCGHYLLIVVRCLLFLMLNIFNSARDQCFSIIMLSHVAFLFSFNKIVMTCLLELIAML